MAELPTGDFHPERPAEPTRSVAVTPVGAPLPRPAPSPAAAAARPGRYVPVRPLARGGLGEVVIARDAELQREVALKRIQAQFAGDADKRRRFLLEATLTARLEHPGVVPVHGLLQSTAGDLCYAMRFIQGETLQAAIERFHKSGEPFTGLAFRQLLQRFVGVCQTLAYAHHRGIIHRDLKPANVMLGPFGETLVVDWGLAKEVAADPEPRPAPRRAKVAARPPAARAPRRRPDQEATAALPGGQPGPVEDTAPEGATRAGAVLGTPGYMSPEQATGRTDTLGPASDVYSLGATLYVLLTGRPAFTGGDVLTVLRNAAEGTFPPPRQIKGAVPKPLQAICLKAMALDPADRYKSAAALATDLEHWLADEPVRAYRDGGLTRLARWGRRHRTAVAGLGALLLTGLVAAVAGLGLLNAKQRETDAARQRADANFAQARQAMNRYFDLLKEDADLNRADLNALQVKLLQATLPFFQNLANLQEGDPQLTADQARAFANLALVRVKLGEAQQAAADYERAVRLYEQLAAAAPGDQQRRLELAQAYNNQANNLVTLRKFPEAAAAFTKAQGAYQQLDTDFPGQPEYRHGLATIHLNLGVLYDATGQRAESEAALRQALAVQEKLAKDFPAERKYRLFRDTTRGNLGILLHKLERWAEAEAVARQALEGRLRLAEEDPSVPEFRMHVGSSYVNLGALLADQDRLAEAAEAFRQADARFARLAAEFPTVANYRHWQGMNALNQGRILQLQGQYEEAVREFRKGQELYAKLAADAPGVPQYLEQWARSHLDLGHVAAAQVQPAQALEWADRALQILEPVRPKRANDGKFQHLLNTTLGDRADALSQLGRHGEALKVWEAVVGSPDFGDHLEYRMRQARARARAGQAAEALAAVDELARQPNVKAAELRLAAGAYAVAASLAADAGQRGQYADRAMALLQQSAQLGIKGLGEVRGDRAFDVLKDREDFRQLVKPPKAEGK